MSVGRKMKLQDDIYAELYCDECGNEKALYLGDNIDDILIYADNFLDKRYFDYSKNNTKL